ncbi:MAG: hypothetical protein CMH64_01550 [Nanoarchaeota archaeon]|nr:hypothetical protein [Nanoarchaeota archaeon]|tara:strand:+ start:773 stop:1051 length:279 start_codon:yes stop_codon:yes gene_type:complete
MEIRSLNYILAAIGLFLAINLIFPLGEITGSTVDDLSCEINGNYVPDFHLCCSEMAKFSNCENGECVSENYNIRTDKETLRYCEERGYNVRF